MASFSHKRFVVNGSHATDDVSRRALICRLALGTAGALGANVTSPTRAQLLPHRLRILCGSGAGGTPDAIARIYAAALNPSYADGVLVDNRPGAGGQIAIGALKHSAADGTTVLLTHGAVTTVYPSLYRKLAYDPVLDLAPVSLAGETAYGIAVGPVVSERVQRLDGFTDWAHEHPASCSYGTPGVGTLPHLLGATLFRNIGIDAQHVAYSSGPLAITDVLAGRVSAAVLPEGLLRSLHEAGRLRILATSGEARSRFIPDTPTLAEQGYPNPFRYGWFGFFMPGTATPDTIEWMSQATRAIASMRGVQSAFDALAIQARTSHPAELTGRIASERLQWQTAIATLGLPLE